MHSDDLSLSEHPKKPTVFDRVAVAFSSGLFTLVLASLVWLGFFRIFDDLAGTSSFTMVLLLSGAMAALGFALKVNPVIAEVRWLIRVLMSGPGL